MLEFPNEFTENKEINVFLHNFCNNAIKNKLHNIIVSFETKTDVEEILYYDGILEDFFPENWPGNSDDMLYIMKGLYSLLHSDKEFVPTLIMEYVMAKIIDAGMSNFYYADLRPMEYIEEIREECRNNELDLQKYQDIECGVPFKDKTYEKIKTAYYEDYLDYFLKIKEQEAIKYAEEKAKYMVESLWHWSPEWFEFCFWDNDFTYLDEMTLGELRHSPINACLGIVDTEPSYDDFYLPEDWEHSKDFHYLNRPERNDNTFEDTLTE